MAMLRLPNDIQSLFCASTQICNYKRAVEELVYNSLDAESTSIAVRVNIEQNSIQVIDNGYGVSKCNFSLIGQRHATSKCIDLSTLKSVPSKYGYRGQSLASIIDVSQSVKITSRCQDSEETWIKSFYKGKEQKLYLGPQRPSKGATIEIKGFLYNLKIQRKAIDSLNELNDIKSFLEQLSLVHNNISLSLRDDTKNDIIFQLHKNRDIYQTLRSMFEIERTDLQELKVEKNNYKVSAFIAKKDKELGNRHWIYLNGKYLQSHKFQKIVNDNMLKSLKLNEQNRKKVKSKNPYNQEDDLQQKGIPCYFIFITCPYYDYDINQVSKQTVVEFKDWEPINKLIEKMAKLFVGDTHMKEFKPIENQLVNNHKTDDTRDQVKKIMNKILGSNPRRIGISQMQNGIKGKITKRRPTKNNTKILNLKAQEVKTKKENKSKEQPLLCDNVSPVENSPKENKVSKVSILDKITKTSKVSANNIKRNKIDAQKKMKLLLSNNANRNKKDIKSKKGNNKTSITKKLHEMTKKKHKTSKNYNDINPKNNLVQNVSPKKAIANKKQIHKSKKLTKKHSIKSSNTIRKETVKPKLRTKNFIKIFEQDPTGSVKRRCNILANKVDNLMSYKSKRKQKIYINETVQYSNVIKDNKNYSIRKKIGEIVIHDYIPKPPTFSPSTFDGRVWDRKSCKSTYDLMKTILRTQEIRNSCREIVDIAENNETSLEKMTIDDKFTHNHENIFKPTYVNPVRDSPNISLLPRLTFESHNYLENCNQISHNYNIKSYAREMSKENAANMHTRFINNRYKENFVIPIINPKSIKTKSFPVERLNNIEVQTNNLDKFTKQFESQQESSYTIEFSKSNEKCKLNEIATTIQSVNILSNTSKTQMENGTYTIEQNNENNDEINLGIGSTYTIDNSYYGNAGENEENVNYIEDSTEKMVYGQSCQNVTVENESFNTCFIHKTNNRTPCEDENKSDYIEDSTEKTVHNEKFTNKNQQRDLDMKVVFISKSQEKDIKIQTLVDEQNINPLNICETVLSQDDYEQNNSKHKEWNDSLFNDEFEIDSFLCDRNAYTLRNYYESIDANDMTLSKATVCNKIASENDKTVCEFNKNTTINMDQPTIENNTVKKDTNHFNFKNRLRFVPKGMSQIFTKCQSRNVCDYNPGKDYYEEAIYNDFANNVQLNCEIFEPGVQTVKELTSKAIDKVNYKLNKDNASLLFNGESLKKAKVLKQIDNKFIAAKITGRSHQSLDITEHLVLFDQHAVHERIRLETNLSEYFNGNEWKSIPLDDVKLKVSRDEILYLHNYKNKFTQLGLQWTVLSNDEVAINAIPLALLGKNSRQVEIVIKAVRNLIVEEINAIKMQCGCISLYPKAIMDLVFSEACRYAIKFGDHLSKDECVNLLTSLSECKTPFQCAHGRPVMAVLMDIKSDANKYTININSIQKWKRNQQNKKNKI